MLGLIINSTATPPNIDGIKTDASITILVVIAVIALISPIFVATINNHFQRKNHLLDLENDFLKFQYNSYYLKATEAFDNMLMSVGLFLGDATDLDKYAKAISCINVAYAYCDEELAGRLDTLRMELGQFTGDVTDGSGDSKGSFADSSEALKAVAIYISRYNREFFKIEKNERW